MMPADQIQNAADTLWTCWSTRQRIAALPEAQRPRTREEGYAIQAQLERRSRFPIAGWKIAATSVAGQAHIHVDGPLAGRLLRERLFESGATVPFGDHHADMRVAEAEFAFRIGRDLEPRSASYTVGEVLDAVAFLHPAIELPDSRFTDFTSVGAAQLIADNACAHHFVLGAEAPADWRSIDLVRHAVRGVVSGKRYQDGCGANVLGDPREALRWLVNELSAIRVTLRAGQIVTTGTCIVPLAADPGDEVEMDFAALGRVRVRLASSWP